MISLCFVITGLPVGGAEIMLLKILENLDRTRFKPTVISLTTLGEVGRRIEALGIQVHAIGMKPLRPSPLKFIRLVKLIRNARPQVVHTWMYHADLLGGLAARLAGIREVVWCIRNSDLSIARSKRTTLLTMKLCALTSKWLPQHILTCSNRALTVHVNCGYCVEKIAVIPNGFDLTRFQPNSTARLSIRAELGILPDTPLIGMVARDDPQKNHLGFIEAALEVHNQLPDTHFVLAGKGIDNHNQKLIRMIEQSRLKDKFHLLGSRDDVPRLMAALDVLASPSSFGEAFPNVLGEAMACSVPCVVTNVGDAAEIVSDIGRVVEPGDMQGLAENLLALLVMSPIERQQLGARARVRVKNLYEICSVVRKYEDFYRELAKERCENARQL
jgi:glycosyltransferase involved in cell wall biosynthesis